MSMNLFMLHGKYQGQESKAEFIIDSGKVVENNIKAVRGKKPLPSNVAKDFSAFVEAYAEKIVQKWIDYFVLHKEVSCERIDRRI